VRDGREHLTRDLIALLGIDGLIALAEAFGGQRLYVPQAIPDDHVIAKALGKDLAAKISDRYSRFSIRVPMVRKIRAQRYRADGLSNARIAKKLGITEPGVDYIFSTLDNPPAKGAGGDSAQLSLEF